MNILFIYSIQKSIIQEKPLKGQEDIQLGIAQLSSVLKNSGHQTDLLVLDRKYGRQNYSMLDKKIQKKSYGLICYSSVYSEYDFIEKIAQYVREQYHTFAVLGGVHVTVSPDIRYLDIFDALCIGEGEFALAELALRLERNEDITQIPNLWMKKDGRVIQNETREFIQDLDRLPFVDRDIWQPLIFEPNSRLTVLLGRGCPYNCTYCCNHIIKTVASGKYVRMRSAKNIIAELNYLTGRFPSITEYFLEVETLGADIPWLLELCDELYELNCTREQKLTFGANLRVYDTLDFELIFKSLKKANFGSIIIGLESGNERIRKEILNRYYSNDTVVRAVNTARKYGVKVGMFNLVGLPTESYNDFLDTLKLNQELQPDWHATSIFFPYKGTRLYEMCEALGLLKGKISFKDERQYAVMDLPDFPKRKIQRQFDSFHYNVYRKQKNKSMLKLCLYALQIFVGHSFMSNMKSRLTVMLYRLGIRFNMLNIIQKE